MTRRTPTGFAEFLEAFADRLEVSEPHRLPAWLVRPFLGRETTDLLTKPMPTTNDRLRSSTDWEPAYPTCEEGLTQVIETWIDEGTLEETSDGYVWNGR